MSEVRLIDANALKYDLELSKYIVPNNLNRLLNSEINRCIEAIDNAPTFEVSENAVNCVLTEFGNCSYNETGCSDCKIKDKIRKALEFAESQMIGCENCANHNRKSKEVCTAPYGVCSFLRIKPRRAVRKMKGGIEND